MFLEVLEKVNEIQEIKDIVHPLPNNVPHMAIAITKNTDCADRVVQLWNNRWGNGTAFAYHSKASDRQELMQTLKNNKIKLVVVVDMLQEGFDHPPMSIAAILMKIRSPVKFVQFIGRVQRIVRDGEDRESPSIRADIVSHIHDTFQNEAFIPVE